MGKTENGMRLLREIGAVTAKAKETIGSIPVPVKAAEIILTDGSKITILWEFSELANDFTRRAPELIAGIMQNRMTHCCIEI